MKQKIIKMVMIFVILLFVGCGAKQNTVHVPSENQVCYTQNADLTDNIALEHDQTNCILVDMKEQSRRSLMEAIFLNLKFVVDILLPIML